MAALILFAGGDGQIKLGADGTPAAGTNFLVRTRDTWVQQGMAVAIPDVPDNQRSLYNHRTSADYAADIGQIVAYVRTQTKAPIWLVGTSQGTNAAVGGASRMTKGEIAGIVLTSLADAAGRQARIEGNRLRGRSRSHRRACADPLPFRRQMRDHAAGRRRAHQGRAQIIAQGRGGDGERGLPPISDLRCEAKSEHGFYGIEDSVVAQIAAWIKSNSK